MDVFDRALSGELGRPPHQGENKDCDKDCDKAHDMIKPDNSLHDLTWDKYCDTFESHHGETRFVSMLSDEDVGEEIRDTQTAAVDAGSVGTDEVVEPEPAGVDTAHASRSLTAESVLPVKPHWERPRRNGKWISGKASCTTAAVEQLLVSSGLRQDGSPPETSDIKSPVPGVASSGYRKLVDRIMKYRAMECDVGRDIESQRRKYCEAAYKARLTRMMPSGGGTVVEQLAGHRKAARKSFVKAGREFDRVVSGI